MKVILFFIFCYKISPIIFTITIIFCRHVTNVTNVTSRYKISPIIFTITIIFFRHVSNVTSRYNISPILGYRAPLGAITEHIISIWYKSSSHHDTRSTSSLSESLMQFPPRVWAEITLQIIFDPTKFLKILWWM